MKFCNQCSNMLYISIDENDTNKLIYYCRNCGEKDESITDEGVLHKYFALLHIQPENIVYIYKLKT